MQKIKETKFSKANVLETIPQHIQDLFSVEIVETKDKGLGLKAKRDIKKGDIVCFYPIILKPTKNTKAFPYFQKGSYLISLDDTVGRNSDDFAGDICPDFISHYIVRDQKYISYLGALINEPDSDQISNVDLFYNGFCHQELTLGQAFLMEIIAMRDIKTEEDILYFYGDSYQEIRSYPVGQRYID